MFYQQKDKKQKKNRSCSGTISLNEPLQIHLSSTSQQQQSECTNFSVIDSKAIETLQKHAIKSSEQNTYELKSNQFALSNEFHSAVIKVVRNISKLIASNEQLDFSLQKLVIVPAGQKHQLKTESNSLRLVIVLSSNYEGFHFCYNVGDGFARKLESQNNIQWIGFKGHVPLTFQTHTVNGHCLFLAYTLTTFDQDCKSVQVSPNPKITEKIKKIQAGQTCAYHCETFYTNGGLKGIQEKDGLKLLQENDLETWLSAQSSGCKNLRLKMLFDENNLGGLNMDQSQRYEYERRRGRKRKRKGNKFQESEQEESEEEKEITYVFSGPPHRVSQISKGSRYIPGEDIECYHERQQLNSVYFLNDQNRNSKYVYLQYSTCDRDFSEMCIRNCCCHLMIVFEI